MGVSESAAKPGVPQPSIAAEVTSWLRENWDPDLTVEQWWQRLASAGWAAPTWPSEHYGLALSNADSAAVHRAIGEFGALGGPGGLGIVLAGPTLLAHGSEDQLTRFLPDIVMGRAAWCQLFSEPAAGSDLAGLQAHAVRAGDGWLINGQKVWTSSGFTADVGMLIARTNPDAPKHHGITYFAVDMHQPGVEVRPLREMTGRSLFSEVFLTDVRVPDNAVIGDVDDGWKVANTTLAYERSGLGAGGAGGAESVALPGSVAGDLKRRAGDFVAQGTGRLAASTSFWINARRMAELARRHGRSADPVIRQRIAQFYTEQELARYLSLRDRGARRSGSGIPGIANMAKLRMSVLFRLGRDLATHIAGADAMLHDYSDNPAVPTGGELDRAVTELTLWSPSPSIYGGTDQIQRNVLAERVLGLPRERGYDPAAPFRDLPRNV
jgi:alkylation response protein AidB-like acyl-CoA dehydrogenase